MGPACTPEKIAIFFSGEVKGDTQKNKQAALSWIYDGHRIHIKSTAFEDVPAGREFLEI